MKTKAYRCGVETLNGNDAWAMFKSCTAGDVRKVKSLLAKDARLVNSQFRYQFPIHMAVREGDAGIVKLLLDHHADPGQSPFLYSSWNDLLTVAHERGFHDVEALLKRALTKKFNYSPDFEKLQSAIESRDARRVGAVLRRQPELAMAADALGNNAIHCSVTTRQLSLIKRFAELGTPIDSVRADGKTPALLALSWFRPLPPDTAIRNRWVIVGDLLARGAKYTISLAAAVGDQERVEQLLEKNPELATRLDSARVSPLSYAAREGHTHIVRLLLEHGANPNGSEDLASDGRALFEACWANHLETAELLLRHGADPNAGLDSSGCCLTIGEAFHGENAKPLQELLRQYGACTPPYAMTTRQMKQAIRDGHEVLQHEEFLGNVMAKSNAALLKLYLDSDPTVSQRTHFWSGLTYPESPPLVRKLLTRGLDPNLTDWLGKTFLHACAENGDLAVAAVFLKAGADINARDVQYKGTPLAAAVRSAPQSSEPDQTEADESGRSMVEFLLKHGAAISLPDDEPWATPMAWARKRALADIQRMLAEHAAR